jgi:hypothetical protein
MCFLISDTHTLNFKLVFYRNHAGFLYKMDYAYLSSFSAPTIFWYMIVTNEVKTL